MQNSNFCVEQHLKLLVQGWKKVIYGSNPMIVKINSVPLSVLHCGHLFFLQKIQFLSARVQTSSGALNFF